MLAATAFCYCMRPCSVAGFCLFSVLGCVWWKPWVHHMVCVQQLLSQQQRGREVSGPARSVPGARSDQHTLPVQVIIKAY